MNVPTLDEIRAAATALEGRIVKTPLVRMSDGKMREHLPEGTVVDLKLELFQNAGSFKARGALLSIDALDKQARSNGVTAVSAGNHALAVSWAANREGVDAKVVMPKTADPVRIEGCQKLGTEVVLVDDIHAAFTEMDRIVEEEGRTAIHPFEGRCLTLGTATCGLEIIEALPELDVMIVPIGGGGLISGISLACKLLSPQCQIIGVEPYGADAFYRSMEAGSPQKIPEVKTIADSLGAPLTMPYSYGIASKNIDHVVRIEDDEMLKAMALLFGALKIAPEPACAATTAAMIGPLKEQLKGKNVAAIACGSNISEQKFGDFMQRARKL